jgi:hypothetical protein
LLAISVWVNGCSMNNSNENSRVDRCTIKLRCFLEKENEYCIQDISQILDTLSAVNWIVVNIDVSSLLKTASYFPLFHPCSILFLFTAKIQLYSRLLPVESAFGMRADRKMRSSHRQNLTKSRNDRRDSGDGYSLVFTSSTKIAGYFANRNSTRFRMFIQ